MNAFSDLHLPRSMFPSIKNRSRLSLTFRLALLLFIFNSSLAFSSIGPREKTDSTSQKAGAIQWPYVYPEWYKINLQVGTFRAGYAVDPQPRALSFGISGELLWTQVLFAGLGYELNFLPETDSLRGGNLYRIALHLGVIIQLDDYERHHLLLHVRPGYSWLGSTDGHGGKMGISLGIGYEYGLSSRHFLSPELMYHAYSKPNGQPYSLKAWTFGLRFTFGK